MWKILTVAESIKKFLAIIDFLIDRQFFQYPVNTKKKLFLRNLFFNYENRDVKKFERSS